MLRAVARASRLTLREPKRVTLFIAVTAKAAVSAKAAAARSVPARVKATVGAQASSPIFVLGLKTTVRPPRANKRVAGDALVGVRVRLPTPAARVGQLSLYFRG